MKEINWLGEINPDWEVAPIFTLGTRNTDKNNGMVCENLLSLSYGKIVRKDINTADGLLPESFESYQIVQPGDTVLRFTDLQNDKRSLRSGLVTEQGIITSAYIGFRPEKSKVVPEYFAYLMRALDLNKVFYRMGSGVRQTLNWDEFAAMRIPLPTPEVQRQIANYLVEETSQIDQMVTELDRLRSLLYDRRGLLINEVATGRKRI